jgi:uncharacterized protein
MVNVMKCPACFNELTTTQVGSVSVDVCEGGCGGIWLDAFELQRVDEQHEEAGERLLAIQRDERIIVDHLRKRDCPRCLNIKLRRHFFSPKRLVEVDECPSCGGYWLDAGELAKIRHEKNAEAENAEARQSGLSTEVIRYIYRLKTEGRQQT